MVGFKIKGFHVVAGDGAWMELMFISSLRWDMRMVRGFRSLKLTQEPRPCQLLGYHIVNDRTTCCTCGLCSAPNCRDPPEGLQETLFIGLVFFGRISALEDSGSHIYKHISFETVSSFYITLIISMPTGLTTWRSLLEL